MSTLQPLRRYAIARPRKISYDERLFFDINRTPKEFLNRKQERTHIELIRSHFDKGASMYFKKSTGIFEFYTYELLIYKQKPSILFEIFLDYGLDVNHLCDKQTILILCILYDREDLVKILIKRGVDLNMCGKYKIPPIVTAITSHNVKITKILLDAGANMSVDNHKIVKYSYAICNEWLDIFPPLRRIKKDDFDEYDLLTVFNIPQYRNIDFINQFDKKIIGKIRSRVHTIIQSHKTNLLTKYIHKYKYFNGSMIGAINVLNTIYYDLCEYEKEIYTYESKHI
jgi:ankyrin repeat protein